MRNEILLVFVILFLAFSPAVFAHADTLNYTMETNHHILGTITVDDYTFPIDALLDDTLPTANRVTYTIRNYDASVFAQALRDCFPATADALVEKLSFSMGDQIYANLHHNSNLSTINFQVLPYTQIVPDEKLIKLQDQCEAFLTQIGLSCHPTPIRCSYLIQGERQSNTMPIPMEDKEKATHIGVYFLPTVDSAVAVPRFFIPRVGGKVKDTGNSLIWETPAMFIFNLDGELEAFTLHNLEMTASGQLEPGFLSWEDALSEMMEELMKKDHVRKHITQNPTTITSIRTAWDSDEAGHGKPGWIISFYTTHHNDTAPLGWDSCGTTYFVYGE